MSVESLILQYGQTGSTTRPTASSDAGGSPVMTYAAHLASVVILIQRSRPSGQVIDGARRTSTPTVGYALAGTDIRARDRVTIGSETFEVTGIHTPDDRATSDALAYRIISLSLVTGEP